MADALDDLWWDEDVAGKQVGKKLRAESPENTTASAELIGGPTKKKRKRKKKNLTQELAENKVKVDARQEFLSIFQKYSETNLLGLEKDEFAVQECHLVDLLSSQHLSPCDRFVQSVSKAEAVLRKIPKSNGCPSVLLIAGSALRTIELAKLFSFASPGFQVAKLFAKHKKVPEHKELLSTTAIKIAVGTPKRICDLLDLDLLSVSKLKFVVLDWHFRDLKLRRLVDTPQIRDDTMTLMRKHLLFKVLNHHVRVVLM